MTQCQCRRPVDRVSLDLDPDYSTYRPGVDALLHIVRLKGAICDDKVGKYVSDLIQVGWWFGSELESVKNRIGGRIKVSRSRIKSVQLDFIQVGSGLIWFKSGQAWIKSLPRFSIFCIIPSKSSWNKSTLPKSLSPTWIKSVRLDFIPVKPDLNQVAIAIFHY